MRIISGFLKGKTLIFLKNLNTRPLKDVVKENIFNILKHSNLLSVNLKEANVLDLYSGIGSFGLESISRGAKKVTFIEKDRTAIKILNENLKKLSIANKSKIFNDNIENVLLNNLNEKFNIFFFDPPFNDKYYVKNLELIKKNKLYKAKHVIIIHRERKTEDFLENYIKVIDIKNYGRSKIIFGFFK